MGGRHRKKRPPLSAKRVGYLCVAGIAASGSIMWAAYGAIPVPEPDNDSEVPNLDYDFTLPQTRPPLEPVIVPPLVLGQEKDAPPSDPTDPPIEPPAPVQEDTESPLLDEDLSVPGEDQEALEGSSEAEPEPPVEPESDDLLQRSVDPEIVEAPAQSTCTPQSGLGLQLRAALSTADIISQFSFRGILDGRSMRPLAGSDHPNGLAVDISIADVELGNSIRDYILENKDRLGVKYVIWRQRYYSELGPGRLMEDRGSRTQNHFDHIHVSFVQDTGPAFAPEC